MNTATQQGAPRDYVTNVPSNKPPNPDLAINEVIVQESPRDISIAAMAERQEAARVSELNEAIAADPGLAASQAQIENQIDAANAAAIAAGELEPPVKETTDGAASVQPMHAPPAAPKPDPLPAELVTDPLSEYIVMQGGKPMFSTKVNGQLQLIPLEDARRELQIGTAAAIRMNEATRYSQQVEQRAQQISASEAALAKRMQQPAVARPAVPAQTDLSEADLYDEAKEIFNVAFTGTEEDAARKLAKTLVKLRSSVAAPAVQAPVDERTIVRKAATAAVNAVQAVEQTKDVRSGYAKFQEDYPDIMTDPVLYKMADDMTDGIEQENPNWPISQVMDEAGKRTRAWVNKMKGVEVPDPDPDPTLQPHPNLVAGGPAPPPTQEHRQERKQGLVRMPTVANAAVHEEPSDDAGKEQSPQEAFDELRRSRGQPA